MKSQYEYVARMAELYNMLEDKLSKDIFWARFAYDFEQSTENAMRVVNLGEQKCWLDILLDSIPAVIRTVEQEHKKLVLYGTNTTGRIIASLFMEKNIDFYGFCGRRANEFTNGLLGKPVISPDYLFQHPGEFYVILTVAESNDELISILSQNHFPQDYVLPFKPAEKVDHQYFDFPSLFHRNTAFIDGGALNCRTSFLFSDWCNGEYSKIFAFEPDPISCATSKQMISNSNIGDIRLIQAGLSDHVGEVSFHASLYGYSHIVDGTESASKNVITIPVTTIDHTVGDEKIGFIKMDIEGSEFDALHGAERVIIRDKPLMAISVYHRIGDMLAIMDYLHQLVPEYRFLLRHYSIGITDTVLYATVDTLDDCLL